MAQLTTYSVIHDRHLSYLYPGKHELSALSQRTGLSESQVNLWFRNARTRSGWSRLYGNKLYAAKNKQKLKAYFDEYEVLRRLDGRNLGPTVATNDVYAMVEKILKWFRVKKPAQSSDSSSSCQTMPLTGPEPDVRSVRPWVKDVLFSTLAALRSTASPPQKLVPSLPSLGWPSLFSQPVTDVIDPSLQLSSSECSSDESSPGSSRLTCGSSRSASTWSSVSTSSSRSSSPSSPSERIPAFQYSTYPTATSSSAALPLTLPSSIPPASDDVPVDPQLDISASLLFHLSSDAFSPLSTTHEPCVVATGQFDDADEE